MHQKIIFIYDTSIYYFNGDYNIDLLFLYGEPLSDKNKKYGHFFFSY